MSVLDQVVSGVRSHPTSDHARETAYDMILRIFLVGSALVGVPNLVAWNYLPMGLVLHGMVGLLLVVVAVGPSRPSNVHGRATWILLPSGYVTAKMATLWLGTHHAAFADLIQAYKAY